MRFKEINLTDIDEIAKMYVETFNAPPWNDAWTIDTSSKRLSQMINCEEFYGITAYENQDLCGMIMGSYEQFYNGVMFNVKEFCVKNEMRNKGYGTKIFEEFEKLLIARGVSEIVLFTLKDDSTETFYRKRGLRYHDEMVIMGKRL